MGIVNITKENFDSIVLQSEKKVLLDFWASWCGPCQMYAPIVEAFSNEYEEYVVGKINVDEEKDLALKYDVMSIPTTVVIDKGEEINRISGVISKDMILNLMNTEA